MAHIQGTPGNDFIWATDSDDVVYGSAGNDKIDGGEGIDTVVYTGNASDYSISLDHVGVPMWEASSWTVTSAGKIDWLYDVQRVAFTNILDDPWGVSHAVALDLWNTVEEEYGAAGLLNQFYHAALGRSSDPAGFGYWLTELDMGASPIDVAGEFLGSAECESLLGDAPSNDQFLQTIYQNLLHRAPDQAGLDFWNDALTSGTSTREQVLVDIVTSDEAVRTMVTFGNYYTSTFAAEYLSGIAYDWSY